MEFYYITNDSDLSSPTQNPILSIVESHEQSDLIICWTIIKENKSNYKEVKNF